MTAQSANRTVSVVVATRNRLALLREAIASIRAQHCADGVEIVVVDDGSTDGTAKWLLEECETVIARTIEHSGNLATVRNAGLDLASGYFVMFFDDDDLQEEGCLSRLADALDQHPDAGFSFGDYRYFSSEHVGAPRLRERWQTGRTALWNLVAGTPLPLPATLFRRDLLLKLGGLASDLPAAEDYDLCLRAASISEGVAIDMSVTRVRRHEHTMSEQQSLWGTANAIRALLRLRQRGQLEAQLSGEFRRTLARLYADLSRRQMERGRIGAALLSFGNALVSNPFRLASWREFARGGRRLLRSS